MRIRIRTLGSVWAALALVGCGGGEPAPDAPGTGADTSAAGGGDPPPEAGAGIEGPLADALDGPTRIIGHVLIGPDRRDFQACEGGAEYWVDGPALPELFELHDRLTPGAEPFESIFVDVFAEAAAPPERGAGSELSATIDVLEVRRAAFEGFGCQETPANIVAEAGGNEPFWRLALRDDGATFSTPEGERSWTAGALTPSPEGWRVEGTTETGEEFTLVLEVGGCTDSMSGAWSHLAATLHAEGREWTGCAWLGEAGEA